MLPLLIPMVAALAPSLVTWLFGDKAGHVAGQVTAAVQAVTGADPSTADGAAVATALLQDRPELAAQLQTQLLQLRATMQAQADQAAQATRQAELDTLRALITSDALAANVNAIEASSSRLFVSGWRPFVGWICGAGLAWVFVAGPFAAWATGRPLVPVDVASLLCLLQGLLGLASLRTYEKTKGLAPGS